MSAETFTTAMFLITAVIAAGVLINAVFPVVYQMAGTFSSSTHESDDRLRTDFKIITTLSRADSNSADIWIKNIGSTRIAIADLKNRADVMCGSENDFGRLSFSESPTPGNWGIDYPPDDDYWEPGETIQITAYSLKIPTSPGEIVYFQFILPNGVWRSQTFAVSAVS
jgi:flagellar protein FlaG